MQAGATEVHITLPSHTLWYEALAGQSLKVEKANQLVSSSVNMDSIPVFYRGGAIVPRR
jgi:alpha-glucosidase (family GH31 glycosyl hydrolase)